MTITEPFCIFNNLRGIPVIVITGTENLMNEDVILGRLLGRREAFNLVAARCTAAEVEAMRQIRDQKLYLKFAPDFNGFCVEQFHTGGPNINRMIRVLEEFGPRYYEFAQLV